MKIFFVIFFILSVKTGWSQIRDRASLNFQQMSSRSGEGNFADAWISERWALDSEGLTMLQAGVQARRTELPNGFIENQELWMVVPQLNLLHSLSDTYSLIANFRYGAFGDLEDINGRTLRAEGAVIIDKYLSDTLTFGLGIARGTNFGKIVNIPVVHIIWMMSDKWMLDALLPSRLDLVYLPNAKMEVGLAFNIVGSRYTIESEERKIDSLGVGQMNLGPFFRYQILPQTYLGIESGVAFGRRLSLMDENTEITEFNPENEAYLKTGIQYRF